MTLLDSAARRATAVPPEPVPLWRARVVAVCIALVALAFMQDPGRIAADTKLDLTVDPWGFLSRSLHLWDPQGFFGQLQNQAYGYLWPMGPFFGIGQALGLPDWVTQRLWWSVVLVMAFLGMYLLLQALRVGRGWPQILAALGYALAVRPQSALGAISVEVWPMAVAPWVLLPLVRGAFRGNVVRAAALSAVAVAAAGGVNAVAAGAVLPLAVWWLITLTPGPRRRRLSAWWAGLTLLAILWWLIPLVMLGRYSPPFLDWIESAAFTTSITDPTTVLRGANHWVAYLGSASDWTAGWLLATHPVLVVATGVVAAAGFAGLAVRSLPHRTFLVGAVAAGLVLVTAGHTGPLSGLGSDWIQNLLDGAGSPLRNVHKFDLVLRLPLAVAFCHLLTVLWPGSGESRGRVWRTAGTAVLVSALVASWWPAVTGQLTRDRSYGRISEAWREAAFWLEERGEPGRALIVPGASFGQFLWGRTQDEPLQAYGGYPWGVRDAVPLSSAGNIRMLDALEARLQSGVGSPGLAAYLERMGVRYLVVRNDLAPDVQAPPAIRVHQALADSPGIRRVAWFGDVITSGGGVGTVSDEGVGVAYPAVEIFQVTPSNNAPDPRVLLRPATDVLAVQGAPEAILPLADTGLGNRPTVIEGDPLASALTTSGSVVSDTDRRRELTFGYMRDQESATMTAGSPFVQDRPVHDYRIGDAQATTVAAPGLQFGASSSATDVEALWRTPRGATPGAAMDGALDTFWRPGDVNEEVSYWSVTYPQPVTLGESLRIALLDDGATGTRSTSVTVTTDAGTVVTQARATADWQSVAAPAGATSTVRIDVSGPRSPQMRGIREVGLPGDGTSRLVLPAAVPGAGVLLTARPGDTSQCAIRDDVRICSDAFGTFSQDRTGMHRDIALTTPLVSEPRILVAPRDGARVVRALGTLSSVGVSASSMRTGGVPGSARAAFDRTLGTAWQAAPDDEEPVLTIQLPEERVLRGLRLVNRPELNASSPLRIAVRAGDAEYTGFTDPRGLFRFGPVTTNRVSVAFLSTNRVRSRSALGETALPVGVSELALIGADDLRQPLPGDTLVTLPCGAGPDILLDGRRISATSVTGRVEQFETEATLPATVCSSPVRLPAGPAALDVRSSDTFRPVLALFPPVGWQSPTGRPESPDVESWGATERVVDLAPAAQTRVLEVAENFNAGWAATVAGERLDAVRVDGWKQAWVVPAGVGGRVDLAFTPDRGYRAGLLAGLIGLMIVVGIAIRPPRPGWLPPASSRSLPRLTVGVVGVGVLLVFGVLGALLLVVAGVMLRSARPHALPVVSCAGVAGAAIISAAVGISPDPPAVVAQAVLLVAAWAAVLVAGLSPRADASDAAPDAR